LADCELTVRKLGLKTIHETDDNVRNYIRCLPALVYVLLMDVFEAFEILADSIPEGDDRLGR